MIRFPNPVTAVSEIVAKAFAIIGDRDGDGVGGRNSFGIGLSHREPRRPTSNSNEADRNDSAGGAH